MKKEKIIPNCVVCKWHIQFGFIYGQCQAQGGKISQIVFNNRRCKKLYKVKE